MIPKNSVPIRDIRKGRIKIEKHAKAIDALFVQGLNHNIITVHQMDDKGWIIVFKSTKWKVIDE